MTPRKKEQEKEENEMKTGTSSSVLKITNHLLDFDSGLDDTDTEDLVPDPCVMLHLEPPIDGHVTLKTVTIPAFDNDQWPGSLVLPFSVGQRLFTMDAVASGPRSSQPPPLVRYYRLAMLCTSSAPDRFLRDVRRWLETSVEPLLESRDRRWYPVLAGALYVVRAAAAAAAARASVGYQTYAQRVVERVQFNTTADKNDDDNGWGTCDDSARLPNVNVFLLVVFMSLTFIWTGLGVLRCHKAVRFMFESLEIHLQYGLR